MSAEMAVRGAVVAALRGDLALMDRINAVFDGTPMQASAPYAVVGECLGADWGAKDVEGREVRLTIGLVDKGEAAGRLAGMLARVDAVMRGLGAAGDGWRVVTVRFVRSRVARDARAEGWSGLVDYRMRVVREG